MNIASTTFLFVFLPALVGIYFLIPTKNGLRLRNLFMLVVSLFFYAWGEPVFVTLLMMLILLVWMFGLMAEGNKGRAKGKWAVAMTVIVSVGVLLIFKHLSVLLDEAGLLVGKELSFLNTILPIGLSFFCFHAISYVVDIYRGQCHSPKNILYTALYLSVFYKMMQGPIVTYREFEHQIEQRETSWNDVGEGLWRFAIGFGKKMIIATNLQPVLTLIFLADASMLSMADAWMGCVIFMVFLYFDFSGYSDMAIGLGRVFGFRTPENFNYPYISTSIAEYWRRWHITLIAWFRDYLYYPILLGPSVRFRKYLLAHNVDKKTAKTMQNIFVPACVWIVTALWHGTNWNYTLWGLANCALIVVEPYIKPLGNKYIDKTIRWIGVMILLMMMVPLICFQDLVSAADYLKVMFAGGETFAPSHLFLSLMRPIWLFLFVGIIGCFPVVPYVKRKVAMSGRQVEFIWNVGETIFMIAVVVLAVAYLFKNGTVWFMYQQ